VSAAAWRLFADRVAPEREARFPGCVPLSGQTICPLHHVELGRVSEMCAACFAEGWEWTARRFEAESDRLDGSP
jgi:hypothetical protein